MNQIAVAVLKAVLITLIGTIASIAVERVRRYSEGQYEDYHQQPGYDDYDRW